MRHALLLFALLLGQSPSRAQDDNNSKYFESKVLPLLSARCFKCHSSATARPKGGLRLDSRQSVLKGGNTGPSLVPGNPKNSLLVKAVNYQDPDLQMPPKKRLPAGEIRILEEWIRRGAPWFEGAKAHAPSSPDKEITEKDRSWWAFRPVKDPAVPGVEDGGWCRNEIDRFVYRTLKREGLAPAPEADRITLIRRATFDLHGLPPTPEEIDAFVNDPSPDAYARLIDRLLDSPRYGERWGRHWLDLVRYAESDGWRQDAYRPHVWPFRDYVIRSFNDDKPYDQFVLEQLAGDEIAPDDPDVLVGTTYLRHGMYEWNQRNVPKQWNEILTDLTDVTGDVFLGLGMGCARCHDHKFDPILQSDYFRLRSFFAPILPRHDQVLATPKQKADHRAALGRWEKKTAEIRSKIDAIEKPHLDRIAKDAIDKFLPELQAMITKPVSERTPLEHLYAELAYRQVTTLQAGIDGKIKGEARKRWMKLKEELQAFEELKPKPLQPAFIATDAGPVAPPTVIPKKNRVIEPGFITVIDPNPAVIKPLPNSTGRRTALARWLTKPDHPLTTRVIANRIWHYHFGRGLVPTPSDFGHLGEPPSHPELLDWLTRRFVEGGWKWKPMHRRIMLSASYRQASRNPVAAKARMKDPLNRLLWRFGTRRLAAEQIRDAMLAVSGELDRTMGGASVEAASSPRRTIYTKVLRNTRDPVMDAFDAPGGISSTPDRNVTTTATQALLLMNGDWALKRAQAFAARIQKAHPSDANKRIDLAYRLALARTPGSAERDAAKAFLGRSGVAAADSPPNPFVRPMPEWGGQAVAIRDDRLEDRLMLGDTEALPDGDFTIEAVVLLESLYDDAAVRVIASQWKGRADLPGWSFGVTSVKSRYQPRNLILQLVGDPKRGGAGYEVIASGLRVALHKPHYVAVSIDIDETGERGIAFYLRDLSDPQSPLQSARVKHKVTGRYRSNAAFVIGGRDGPKRHGWHGLIGEVRLADRALEPEELLVHERARSIRPVGHWLFEMETGFFQDATGRLPDLDRGGLVRRGRKLDAPLVDFCHVLLNSNEFFYVD